MMFRIRLLTMLAAVTAIALALRLLTHPNEISLQIVTNLSIGALIAAAIFALVWQRPTRWFAAGFAIAATAYYLVAIGAADRSPEWLATHATADWLDAWMQTSQPERTPEGHLLVRTFHEGTAIEVSHHTGKAYRRVEDEGERLKRPPPFWKESYYDYVYTEASLPMYGAFIEIVHWLWGMLIGCIAGAAALWLRRTSDAADTELPNTHF